MSFIEVLFISISMAMDAFAVCLGAGTMVETSGRRPRFRLAFHFGLFQFIMPVLGWLAGLTIVHYISAYDHWVAFGLLAFVGGRMVYSGLGKDEEKEARTDPSRGWMLVLLSIAVSIDALAVGFSLSMVDVTIWYPAVIIGIVTGLVSWLGLRLGNKLGERFGKRMEVIGGLVLLGIGVRILVMHLTGA